MSAKKGRGNRNLEISEKQEKKGEFFAYVGQCKQATYEYFFCSSFSCTVLLCLFIIPFLLLVV